MAKMRCFYCCGDIIWNNDFDESDVIGHDTSGDSGRIVSYFTCSVCGREYEVFEPSDEDKLSQYSKYWDFGNQKDK